MNATDETMTPPPPPPPNDPPPAPGRRLTRSTDDKVLTGLCGGLGRHFGIDPVVFRVAFVVLSIAGGTGILLYLAGWVLIPDDRGCSVTNRFTGTRTRNLALAVLIGAGIVMLVDGWDRSWGHDSPVALALIAAGALFLWSKRDRSGGDRGPVDPVDSGPADLPPSGTDGPPTGTDGPVSPFSTTSSLTAEVAPPPPPPLSSGEPTGGAAQSAAPPTPRPPAAAEPPKATRVAKPPKPPKPRSALVPVTLSLLAVLGGALALLKVHLDTGLAIALLVTGGAMVVGAWRGRAKGLIPVAIILGIGLGAASVIDVPFAGGIGERRYDVSTIADLEPTYRLGIGQIVLDLRRLDLTGRDESVLVTAGIGHIEVIVPDGVEVTVVGHVGAGHALLFDREADGTHVDRRVVSPGQEGAGRLTVRARAGAGNVEVHRASA